MKINNCEECFMSQAWLNKKKAKRLFNLNFINEPCPHHKKANKTLMPKEQLSFDRPRNIVEQVLAYSIHIFFSDCSLSIEVALS